MFSVAPNIVLAPNMTQNAERKYRTQNTNTAHIRPRINPTYFLSCYHQRANEFTCRSCCLCL